MCRLIESRVCWIAQSRRSVLKWVSVFFMYYLYHVSTVMHLKLTPVYTESLVTRHWDFTEGQCHPVSRCLPQSASGASIWTQTELLAMQSRLILFPKLFLNFLPTLAFLRKGMNAPPPFSALLGRPLGVVSPWGWIVHVALLLLYLKMFIYLAVLGLSCGMWGLHCAMQDLLLL